MTGPLGWMVAGSALLVACGGSEGARAPDSEGRPVARSPRSSAPNASPTGRPEVRQSAEFAHLTTLPTGPWTRLAQQITESRNLPAAVEATREALARGGIATRDGARLVTDPVGPAAPSYATPGETVRLALEARHRRSAGRMTAAELAQMLAGFGWPFKSTGRTSDQAASEPKGTVEMTDSARRAMRDETSAPDPEAGADEAERQAALAASDAKTEATGKTFEAAVKTNAELARAAALAPAAEKEAAKARAAEALAARKAAFEAMRDAQAEHNKLLNEQRQAQRQEGEAGQAAWEKSRHDDEIRRRIGPNYAAGEQVVNLMAAWIGEAAKNPEDPRSFTPLFIAEMAKRQDPPMDIAAGQHIRMGWLGAPPIDLAGAPQSQQLRFTLLELQLFAAAFQRGAPARVGNTGTVDRPTGRSTLSAVSIVLAGYGRTPQDPCTELKQSLGALGSAQVEGEVGGAAASDLLGRALGQAVQHATSEGTAAAFGQAMSAVGTVSKIWKLVAFYSDEQVSVSVSPTGTHKPPQGKNLVTFTATAGVSKEDWEEYQRVMGGETGSAADRAVRDCLSAAGLPTLTNAGEIAKDAENWKVEWRLVEGSPPHAYISLANNDFYLMGRLAMKLKRDGPYSASAKLVVDILPESQRNHPGELVGDYVVAKASVDASSVPSLGTLISAFRGVFGDALALSDVLVELAAGWFQSMVMPKAFATLHLDYHCGHPYTSVPTEGPPVADGGGTDEGECLVDQQSYGRMNKSGK
jgi:hypothetical protein